jgi:uncharacterized Zn finger protein
MTLFDAASEAQRKANNDHLAPCPFCGHYHTVIAGRGDGMVVFVHCTQCLACGPAHFAATDSEEEAAIHLATSMWNRIYTLVTKDELK